MSFNLPPELQDVFANKEKLETLRDFASSTFCEENVMFLESCLVLSKTKEQDLMDKIIQKFIQSDSPLQVNIDSVLQTEVMDRYRQNKSDFSLLISAFNHVADLVASDTFMKYRNVSADIDRNKFTIHSITLPKSSSHAEVHNDQGQGVQSWYRGHLLRRKGFFGQWKPFTYMKKGTYIFEFKPGANHVTAVPLNTISLTGSLVETARTITGKPCSFILHTKQGKSYFLCAGSEDEMMEWIDEFARAGSKVLKKGLTNSRASLQQQGSSSSFQGTNSGNSSSSTLDSSTMSPRTPPPGEMTQEELIRAMPILNFLESFTDAIVVSDHNGTIIAFNAAAEVMFGFSKEEIIGSSLKSLMPEPYRSLHDAYMFRHEKFGDEKLIGKTRDLKGTKKGGEVFDLQISLGKLPLKGYFIATIRTPSTAIED